MGWVVAASLDKPTVSVDQLTLQIENKSNQLFEENAFVSLLLLLSFDEEILLSLPLSCL